MMTQLNAKWIQLRDKANALSVRERVIIAGAVAVLLLGVFDQLLLRPWLQERATLDQTEQQLKIATDELSQRLTALETDLANDPNRKLKDSIAQLEARHRQVDVEIAKITDGMIAPELMPSLLGELLSERSGLRVQSIKSSPASQLLSADKEKRNAPAIYRHDLELRLQGSFAQVQDYLRSIEALPQKLVWDELSFAVEHYPKGELVLAVHTLSAREELIRVPQ